MEFAEGLRNKATDLAEDILDSVWGLKHDKDFHFKHIAWLTDGQFMLTEFSSRLQ